MTDSGWRKRQIALDKKAENARELGLNYDIHSCSPFCTRPMCVQEAVQAEREALERIDWTALMRQGGLVTWGDASELGDRVVAAIRARENT